MTRTTAILVLVLTLVAAGSSRGGGHADFVVATDGRDTWSGTLAVPNADGTDGPLASLAGARDAIRRLRQGGTLERDLVVLVRGGRYEVSEPIVFGPQDGAPPGCRIRYATWPGEAPVFSGARALPPLRALDERPGGLAADAARHVRVADVPGWEFRVLFEGDTMLQRARRGPFSPTRKIENTNYQWTSNDRKSLLHYPDDMLRAWPNLADVELFGVPTYGFVVNALPLASVDEDRQLALTAIPATYPIGQVTHPYGILGSRDALWVENVLEGLDEPGEWVLDTRQGRLYLWPSGQGGPLRAPLLCEMIRVQGGAAPGSWVSGLVFEGLTFTQGDRAPWTAADIGLQHDWEMYNKPNALVRLVNTESCDVRQCRFVNSGGTGLRLDLHSIGNRVLGCTFADLGGTGVLLAGYGPGLKDENQRNGVISNHLHDCGRLIWHSPAVFVWQSGLNHIAHNVIHDMPYAGIVVSGIRPPFFAGDLHLRELVGTIRYQETGHPETYAETLPYQHTRDNIVEYNEVYRTMGVLSDGNGIYISGAGLGNVIRRNHVHHVLGHGAQSALRIDDYQEGTWVVENIVSRSIAGGITLKHHNVIENNIVVDLTPVDDQGVERTLYGYVLLRRGPSDRSSIRRNIMCHLGGPQQFYCEARNRQWPAYARECDVDYNLYYNAADPAWTEQFLARQRADGVDLHSIAADPLFVDAAAGDYRLRPDSPAFELGFKPIDVDRIGLLETLPD